MGFVFNPTAAAAAPPFNKGGSGFGLRLSRMLWLKVPLAKAMSKTYNSKKIHFNDFSLY